MVMDLPGKRESLELALIVEALTQRGATMHYAEQSHLDWERVLGMALYHQVFPLLYGALRQVPSARVPQKVRELLQVKCKKNTLRSLTLAGATVEAVKSLEESGVRVIILKGAPLAAHIYGDITLRPSSDIDIWVPPSSVHSTCQVLQSIGYRNALSEFELTERQIRIWTENPFEPNHLVFVHDARKVAIEIHHNLGNAQQVLLPPPACHQTIDLCGVSVPTLIDEDWLVYLILHGARHKWSRLRWLVDISKFMERSVDWSKVYSIAKECHSDGIVSDALVLANEILGAPLPPICLPVPDMARRRIQETHELLARLGDPVSESQSETCEEGFEEYGNYLKQLRQMRGVWRKVRYVGTFFRPTVSEIRVISLPAALYGLYYFIRPFNLCRLIVLAMQRSRRRRCAAK